MSSNIFLSVCVFEMHPKVKIFYSYGVSENANSLDLVTNSLTMDCLFEAS